MSQTLSCKSNDLLLFTVLRPLYPSVKMSSADVSCLNGLIVMIRSRTLQSFWLVPRTLFRKIYGIVFPELRGFAKNIYATTVYPGWLSITMWKLYRTADHGVLPLMTRSEIVLYGVPLMDVEKLYASTIRCVIDKIFREILRIDSRYVGIIHHRGMNKRVINGVEPVDTLELPDNNVIDVYLQDRFRGIECTYCGSLDRFYMKYIYRPRGRRSGGEEDSG